MLQTSADRLRLTRCKEPNQVRDLCKRHRLGGDDPGPFARKEAKDLSRLLEVVVDQGGVRVGAHVEQMLGRRHEANAGRANSTMARTSVSNIRESTIELFTRSVRSSIIRHPAKCLIDRSPVS